MLTSNPQKKSPKTERRENCTYIHTHIYRVSHYIALYSKSSLMETTDRERASDRQKEKRSVNTGLFFSRRVLLPNKNHQNGKEA